MNGASTDGASTGGSSLDGSTPGGDELVVLPDDAVLPSPTGWTCTDLDALPSEPWDLSPRQLIVRGTVADDEGAARAVAALSRSAGIWISLELRGASRLALLEDVARIGTIHDAVISPIDLLSAESRQLLALLADGHGAASAGSQIGWSRRTVNRRLTDIRAALDVDSTIVCLARFRAWLDAQP